MSQTVEAKQEGWVLLLKCPCGKEFATLGPFDDEAAMRRSLRGYGGNPGCQGCKGVLTLSIAAGGRGALVERWNVPEDAQERGRVWRYGPNLERPRLLMRQGGPHDTLVCELVPNMVAHVVHRKRKRDKKKRNRLIPKR